MGWLALTTRNSGSRTASGCGPRVGASRASRPRTRAGRPRRRGELAGAERQAGRGLDRGRGSRAHVPGGYLLGQALSSRVGVPSLGIGTAAPIPGAGRSDHAQGGDVQVGDPLAAGQEAQLDQDGQADDRAPGTLDQLGRSPPRSRRWPGRRRRPAPGHRARRRRRGSRASPRRTPARSSPRSVADGSLPFLRTGHEPGVQVVGDRRGEDETAGLDPHDSVDRAGLVAPRRGSSTTAANPSASASSGVMSLNSTPGCG